jgi:hypothetical protein
MAGTFKNFLALTDVNTGELPGGLSPSGGTGVLYHAKPVIIQGAWLASRATGGAAAWRQFQPAMEALLAYWAGSLPGSSSRRVDARTGLPLWHDQLETGCDNLVFSQCPSSFSPECWSESACAFTLSSPDLVVFLAREHTAYARFLAAWAAGIGFTGRNGSGLSLSFLSAQFAGGDAGAAADAGGASAAAYIASIVGAVAGALVGAAILAAFIARRYCSVQKMRAEAAERRARF